MNQTKIEWATLSWNPWSGCVPISAGCKNCYAKTRAERLAGGKAFPKGFGLTIRGRSTMLEPLTKLAPARVFVNSMTDLFWDQVTDEMIDEVFAVILANHILPKWNKHDMARHQFLVLTKRADRMASYFAQGRSLLLDRWGRAGDRLGLLGFPRVGGRSFYQQVCPSYAKVLWPLPNLWMGVSVENNKTRDRLQYLQAVPAAIRFVSFEPLLEQLGPMDLSGLHWAIIGGESGNGSRPMHTSWALDLLTQCKGAGLAVFVKQMGTWWRQMHGTKDLKGGDPTEWLPGLDVREFPEASLV